MKLPVVVGKARVNKKIQRMKKMNYQVILFLKIHNQEMLFPKNLSLEVLFQNQLILMYQLIQKMILILIIKTMKQILPILQIQPNLKAEDVSLLIKFRTIQKLKRELIS